MHFLCHLDYYSPRLLILISALSNTNRSPKVRPQGFAVITGCAKAKPFIANAVAEIFGYF